MKKRMSVALKFVLSFALTTGLFVSISLPSYAQSVAEETGEALNQGIIDLNTLDELGENVSFREVSYDEAMASIAALQGISIEEAKRIHPDQTSKSLNGRNSILANDVRLVELSIEQGVTNFYKPALKIYVYTYYSGSFRQFNNILTVQLDLTSSNLIGGTKGFSGSLQAEILDYNSTQMFWLINGDFYDRGDTAISGGIEAGGKIWKGIGTLTYTSNHFKYWYNTGTYNLY